MPNIVYRKVELEDVPSIVNLHIKTLQDGLLYRLGRKAMNIFYETGIKEEGTVGFVALDDSEIIGCSLASEDIKKIYRKLIVKPYFLFCLVRNFINVIPLFNFIGNKDKLAKAQFTFLFIEEKHRNMVTALKLINITEEGLKKKGDKSYFLDFSPENISVKKIHQYRGCEYVKTIGKGNDTREVYVRQVS